MFSPETARKALRRFRLPRLAEIHDSQHGAIVGVELDLSLASHPHGSHAGESELPTDVIVGEGQQGFADWLSICQPEVIERATNEISEGLGAGFHRGGLLGFAGAAGYGFIGRMSRSLASRC